MYKMPNHHQPHNTPELPSEPYRLQKGFSNLQRYPWLMLSLSEGKKEKERRSTYLVGLFFTQEWKVIGISNLVHSFPMAWIIHDASLRSRGQSRGHTKFGYKIYTGIDQRMHGELHIVSAIAVINIVVDSHRFFEYGKCYVVSNCIYNES